MRHLRCKESLSLGDALTLSCARRTGAVGADRSPAAAPVETLAPAFAPALPSLDGQPATYSHEVNGEMLYELCAALVRMGLGTPEIADAAAGEDPLPSCSAVEALGRQEPFMNQTLATSALPCWRDFSAMAGSSIIADPSTPQPAK